MLCSVELASNTTGVGIFTLLINYLAEHGLDWKCCVGICTDGAAVMTAVYSGVVARIKEVAPYCKATHCIIHREMLETKNCLLNLTLFSIKSSKS
jgi:hypothetical protein